MAYLTINGTDYEPKTNFKFEKLANEKYNEESGGEKIGGFMSIYFKLLQYDNDGLLAFWDCGLHHYAKGNNKPSTEAIEEALEEIIEADPDQAFKDAFTVLDQSGFFKKKVKTIWSEFTKAQKPKKNETEKQKEEREKQEEMAKTMVERRKELTSTSSK